MSKPVQLGLVASAVAASLFSMLAMPRDARACGEHVSTSTGRVGIIDDAERVRSTSRVGDLATWMRRTEALLPGGSCAGAGGHAVTLDEPDDTSDDDHDFATAEWNDPKDAFEAVVKRARSRRAKHRRALALGERRELAGDSLVREI